MTVLLILGSFIAVNEAFTTKYQSLTGHFVHNIGADKKIFCFLDNNRCRVDRDINAARNILVFSLARVLLYFDSIIFCK